MPWSMDWGAAARSLLASDKGALKGVTDFAGQCGLGMHGSS